MENNNNVDNINSKQNQENISVENETQTQKEKNKSAIKKIALFILILVIFGGAYLAYWFLYAQFRESTDDSYVNGYQNSVTSQVNGNIKSILVQDTQKVKAGQLLVEVDETDAKINLEQAQSNLGKAVRNLYGLKFNTHQSQIQLQSKSQDLTKAQADFQRDTEAFKSGLLSKEQYDASKNTFEQASLSLAEAKKAYDNSQIQSLTSKITDHPDVKAAIAQYQTAYLNLQRTKIYAPIDGTVAKKSVYVGQRVSTNQELLSLVDLNDAWVDANFKESQLKHIQVGQKVDVESDVNGKTYEGIVVGISAGSGSALSLLPAQNATGNWIKIVQRIPVRIDILPDSLKKNGPIPIGSSTNVTVHLDSKSDNALPSTIQSTNIFNQNDAQMNENIQKIINANLGKNNINN